MSPEAASFEPINDRIAKAIGTDGTVMAYLGVSSNIGYGGPMFIGTVISPQGGIQDVVILEHKETPSYIYKITQAGYFRQYAKKQTNDALVLDYDIDRVSGATLSTRAIAKSVQDVAHIVATKELNVTPEKANTEVQVGFKEIAVAVLFILSVFIPRFKVLARYRLVFLGLSIIILGFWLNRSLSIAHVGALFLGYFPEPSENLIWYIVLAGALLPALFTGKNLYCTFVCPFCGLQEATHLISKVNLPLGKYLKWLRIGKDILLFIVLFFAFLNLNPSIASYEPFGTIFGLNGSSYSWYLLFVILITSFFYRRFWCVAFCPVGTFLDKLAGIGRNIRRKVPLLTSKGAKGAIKNEESIN
jgi:uncharacterized protein with FMN-binding domain